MPPHSKGGSSNLYIITFFITNFCIKKQNYIPFFVGPCVNTPISSSGRRICKLSLRRVLGGTNSSNKIDLFFSSSEGFSFSSALFLANTFFYTRIEFWFADVNGLKNISKSASESDFIAEVTSKDRFRFGYENWNHFCGKDYA